MCNKCESTQAVHATPLLAYWAERVDAPYRNVAVRDHIKSQHQNENIQYWSHARRGWVDEHKANQSRGHDFAKHKAIANKIASREATTLQDNWATYEYLKALENTSSYLADKVEPTYMATLRKIRDGAWEALDIMNTLHPYVNSYGTSAHEDYQESQRSFIQLDALHRVHISTEDINQIAYYPTLKHMREGREVRTRLGRYLTKYQQALSLTDSDIKNIAEKHSANMRSRGGWEVDFVAHDDADGWLTVYQSNDVSSCMRGMDAVRIYAHEKSVLRLAYVKAGEKIIARCIVRDDEYKGWVRVYPDANGSAEGRFLLDYLKTNGYERQTNLEGALLRYITEGGSIVCPYIDYGNGGDQSVSVVTRDDQRYLEVGGGEYSATETNGYCNDDTRECDRCGDRVDEDETTYIECDGVNVCECCRDNDYCYAYGRKYEEYYPEGECVQVGDFYYWKETLEYHDIFTCEHDGEWYHLDDLVTTCDGVYHRDYVVSIDREDNDGNDFVHMDKVHTLSDGTTCHVDDADKYQLEIDDQALEMVEANQE